MRTSSRPTVTTRNSAPIPSSPWSERRSKDSNLPVGKVLRIPVMNIEPSPAWKIRLNPFQNAVRLELLAPARVPIRLIPLPRVLIRFFRSLLDRDVRGFPSAERSCNRALDFMVHQRGRGGCDEFVSLPLFCRNKAAGVLRSDSSPRLRCGPFLGVCSDNHVAGRSRELEQSRQVECWRAYWNQHCSHR